MRTPKKQAGAPKVKPKPKSGNKSKSKGSGKQKKEAAAGAVPNVWKPGVDALDEDEELEYDYTAYSCFHQFQLDWACLSCDIIRDSLGGPRSTFPHTMYLTAGTQAASAKQNYIALIRLTELDQGRHGVKAPKKKKAGDKDKMEDDDDEEDDDDMSESTSDSEDEDDEKGENPPKMNHRFIAHSGAINRLRSMPQQPAIIAAWSDTGQVRVFDATRQLNELSAAAEATARDKNRQQVNPVASHSHSAEGFALDWSASKAGRLVSGDCRAGIHVWEPANGGTWQVGAAHRGHEDSVEDLQWSPCEDTVFASCSVDKTIRIWDVRERAKPMLSVIAHDADVNVISWNKLVTYMLASGSDDGCLRVWDLRSFSAGAYVSHFSYHTAAVTSVEWCPYEGSMLASAGADNQILIWDLALERDPEEEAALASETNAAAPEDLPAQLLFVHAGQRDPKEVHWHPQIPGLILSTGADGFNVFKASNT